MYTEFEDDWTWQAVEAEVLALAEETVALGDAVEDAFKNAGSAFYGSASDAARVAVMAPVAAAPIIAKIVAVLRQPTLAGEHYRRIGELQQIAGAFALMGKHCRDIATVALELSGAAETLVARTAPDVYERLRLLIHQTYIALRGSLVAVRAGHAPTARHVLEAVAELDHIVLDLRLAAQRAIAMHPDCTVPLQQVVVAGGKMRDIGMQAQAIARLVAQAPASADADTDYN